MATPLLVTSWQKRVIIEVIRSDNQEKQEAIAEALEVAGVSHLPKFIAEKVKSNSRYFGVFNIEATHQCFAILMLVLSTD